MSSATKHQQQGADHLVGAEAAPSEAGDAAPDAAGRPRRPAAARSRQAPRETCGAVQRERRGGDAADRDLALAAHIGEVGAIARMKPRPTSDSATARLIEAPTAKVYRRRRPERLDRLGHGRRWPPISSTPIIEPTTATAGQQHAGRRRRSRQRASQRGSCDLSRHQARWRPARSGRPPLAHDAAAIEHGDAVGDGDQFVELARDQQDADTAARAARIWR